MAHISEYKHLIKSREITLKEYAQLSDFSKVKARQEVLNIDVMYYQKQKDAFKSKLQNNINQVVNNKVDLPALIRRNQHIKKISSDMLLLEKYIIGNLCHFLEDGTYVTYSIK